MPKMIDVVKEAEVLEKALAKGESPRRQFVFRLDVGPAVNLIRRCNQEGKQPGPMVEEILTDYFSTWAEGIHMRFPQVTLAAIDRVAVLAGSTREDVVRQLVTDNITNLLKTETERNSLMQSALDQSGGKSPKPVKAAR